MRIADHCLERAAEHVVGQTLQQTGTLERRQEHRRAEHGAIGAVPACQHLGATQRTRGGVVLRLEVRLDLLRHQRMAKLFCSEILRRREFVHLARCGALRQREIVNHVADQLRVQRLAQRADHVQATRTGITAGRMQQAAGLVAHDHHTGLAATVGQNVDQLHAGDVLHIQIQEHDVPRLVTQRSDRTAAVHHALHTAHACAGQCLDQRSLVQLVAVHDQGGADDAGLDEGQYSAY
ncbi:hypothetical protein D3C81_1239750 [compost metagenome]